MGVNVGGKGVAVGGSGVTVGATAACVGKTSAAEVQAPSQLIMNSQTNA
jgi:hypothetical protein